MKYSAESHKAFNCEGNRNKNTCSADVACCLSDRPRRRECGLVGKERGSRRGRSESERMR
jgi:hypothetical protein